jgi:transposase
LSTNSGRVSGKAPIADAIRYALHHWEGLTRFLDDGRMELDTNIVERSIRASYEANLPQGHCSSNVTHTASGLSPKRQAFRVKSCASAVHRWPATSVKLRR